MKKTLLFMVVMLSGWMVTGCHMETCNCPPDQPVLFQYEYINYAWGYLHHGFLIDQHGKVYGFSQPVGWRKPDSSGIMSRNDLELNLSLCDTLFFKLNTGELYDYFSQVKEVREGKILDSGVYMADAGTGVFSAWYRDKESGGLRNVFLESNGDFNCVNNHPLTYYIVSWLKDIGERTDRFYWFD